MTFRYIAVEGPPGAGKTELAQGLATRLDGVALHEEKNNPFLHDFLAGKSGAAFQAQIFFLLNRYRQLSGLAQRELFSQTQVADFILARDKVHAYLNLDDTELMLYEKIYGPIAAEVPSPEIVVYLQVPADVLAKRARQRFGTDAMEEEDLLEIVRAYDYFFFHYSQTPLLVVSSAEVDFSDPEIDLTDLLQEIQLMPGGTRFYVPVPPL
jgi:deoxyadenosine/deoxycytidine kinase